LLREEGLVHRSALFGALAFQFLPKLIAHYGAGHLTLIYAVPWTPWLLWASYRSRRRRGIWNLLPPILLALICLADVRWAIYAGLLWIIFDLSHSRQPVFRTSHKNHNKQKITIDFQNNKYWISNFLRLMIQSTLAILLSCPLLVPLYEFIQLSTRSAMIPSESLIFSLSPARILGLLYPDLGGNHELMVYSGGVVLTLILTSAIKKGFPRGGKFWIWVGIFTLFLSMGSYLPFYSFLTKLPGFNLMRVPSRALFLAGLAFAAASAHSVQQLLKPLDKKYKGRIKIALTVLNTLTIGLAVGIGYISGSYQLNFLLGTLILFIASIIIITLINEKISPKVFYACLLVLSIFDWGIIDHSVLSFHSKDETLSVSKALFTYIAGQEGNFRVYSPSYSLPQHVAVEYGIELVDGVDPLYLSAYADFMEIASGVPSPDYGVTIPPFDNGNPNSDNAIYSPDPIMLGLLNTRYVVSEFDLFTDGLQLLENFGGTRIYLNNNALPRSWVQPDYAPIGTEIISAKIISKSPNRIEIEASGPGVLILSEIYYPGWKAEVNEKEMEIIPVENILRSVELPEGDNEIIFVFRPISVTLGLIGFGVGLFFMIFYYFMSKLNKYPFS